MKILHLYPKSDDMIARHVSLLAEGMHHSAEVQTADSLSLFKTRFAEMKPDVVHCHGCWQYAINKAVSMAYKKKIRIVISPHGQLEPWVAKEDRYGKSVLLQRRTTERAYALIAFGKMERRYLEQLGWNRRIEVIHNAITTNSISPKEMCSQTFAVYQKVIDSNVLEQMGENSKQLLANIIKAGITGDRRWITQDILPENADWRRILIYAEHQNISNYVDYGINILGLQPEWIDVSKTNAYFPEKYQRPSPIKGIVGDYQGDETDYLVRIIRQIQKAPLLLHLIELHRELLRDSVDDDRLAEALEEKHLLAYAARLMQVLHEQTLLDEGYMPLTPIDDRGTRQIRNLITNHLRI